MHQHDIVIPRPKIPSPAEYFQSDEWSKREPRTFRPLAEILAKFPSREANARRYRRRVTIYDCSGARDTRTYVPAPKVLIRHDNQPVKEFRGAYFKPVGKGRVSWTVKVTLANGFAGYLTGISASFSGAVQDMTYCIAKGDWRLDKQIG